VSFFTTTWGDVAGVAGLGVSIATLVVAQKARQAAQAAKAVARRRSLTEELQETQSKAEQVGLFIRDRKWDIVFIRAQEIAAACSLVRSRWAAELKEDSENNIAMAQTQAESIADVAMRAPAQPPSEEQVLLVSRAQQLALRLLSEELGGSLKTMERS
jgi:hypothetical protein